MANDNTLGSESALTRESVELLQTMIRNECVNDGSPGSGHESRNADVLTQVLEGTGLDIDRFEPFDDRASIVARIEGSDPTAPSLCLMGHTDVVPVTRSGWSNDPFGGELIDGEIWGRGAVDMLNLTSSMAVAFRHLADTGFTPKGDLLFFGVADEEAGSGAGAGWFFEHDPDAIRADYVLTESGGLHLGSPEAPQIVMNVGEKGIEWRRLRVRGTPGHGSRPFRADNALIRAAAIVQRLAEYRPPPRFHELWRHQVHGFGFDEETTATLLDPTRIDQFLEELPFPSIASHLYSCTHATFSPNVAHMPPAQKTNVIPDNVVIEVDIRTLPGETSQDVDAHLREALGDLADAVEMETFSQYTSTMSPTTTPLWDSVQSAVSRPFPTAEIAPHLIVGFTDSRIYREMGAVAYGAGLFSPSLDAMAYSDRFHGNDERIDIESMALSTQFFIDVARDFLG
jgi:acetylornithine deacetylase/succinyl-diaminopimelate desuccinylase-like protein